VRFLGIVIFAFASVRLFAGCGLFLDLGNPAAVSDPAARGSYVIVRLFNCLGASDEGAGVPEKP